MVSWQSAAEKLTEDEVNALKTLGFTWEKNKLVIPKRYCLV